MAAIGLISYLLDEAWTPAAVKPRTDSIPDDCYGKRRHLVIQGQRGSA